MAPAATGQLTGGDARGVYKSTATTDTASFSSYVYGGTATTAAGTNVLYPQFKWINDLNGAGGIGGFTDWYIPALDEMAICYYNLNPAWTVSGDFQTSGTEEFATSGRYHTATQYSGDLTLCEDVFFGNPASGTFTQGQKTAIINIRAVRRVLA